MPVKSTERSSFFMFARFDPDREFHPRDEYERRKNRSGRGTRALEQLSLEWISGGSSPPQTQRHRFEEIRHQAVSLCLRW